MSTAIIPASTKDTLLSLRRLLEDNKKAIQAAIPRGLRHLDADRLTSIALTTVASNPALLKCEPYSIAIAVKESAGLGLQIDGILGQAYLIPYGPKAKLQVGYKGYITLAARNPNVVMPNAEVVYDCDQFSYSLGTRAYLKHRPADVRPHDAKPTHAWAIIRFRSGQTEFKVLTAQDVAKRRAASRAASKPESPWNTHPDAMWQKSALRALLKYAPLEETYTAAIIRDEMREAGIEDEAEKLRELHETKELIINAEPVKTGGLYDLADTATANRIYAAYRKICALRFLRANPDRKRAPVVPDEEIDKAAALWRTSTTSENPYEELAADLERRLLEQAAEQEGGQIQPAEAEIVPPFASSPQPQPVAPDVPAAEPPAEGEPEGRLRTGRISFETLKRFGEAKKIIGEASYYRVLGIHGFEKSNEIRSEEAATKILTEMREIAREQKEKR